MRKIFNYSEFINEESKNHFSSYKGSRSESLDHLYTVYDIEDLLKKYAPWFLEEENIDTTIGDSKFMPIYRGIDRGGNILKVNPSKHERVSRNTENYYTLIIDNTWEGFPKRGSSLICSTSKSRAKTYGRAYRVIPTNKDALFGVAPERDVWISFNNGISELNDKFSDIWQYTSNYTGLPNNLNDLNGFLKDAFGLSDKETIETLKEKLSVHNFVDNNVSIVANGEDNEDLKTLESMGDLYKLFAETLSPKLNGFKTVKFPKLQNTIMVMRKKFGLNQNV
jgi:hypothetical protein